MVRLLLLLAVLLASGCAADVAGYSEGEIQCGRCRRTIYSGRIVHYHGGFQWPEGTIRYCVEGDKNCVSEFRGEKELYQVGKGRGYNDATDWKPRKRFEPLDFYHSLYVNGYNEGWQAGIRDRRGDE